MRIFVFAGLVAAILGAPASAQSLLGQLENNLSGAAAPAPGYLGFTPDEQYAGNDGVRVIGVKPGGPSEAAGLKVNDLVKAIDGRPVSTVDEMDKLQQTTRPGQKWQLTVDRGGKLQTIMVTLGTRPPPAPAEGDPGEAPLASPATVPPAAAPPTTAATAPGSFPALTPPGVTSPATTPPATTPPTTAPPDTTPLDLGAAPGSSPIRSRPLDSAAPPPEPMPPTESPTPEPTADLPAPAAGGGASLGITVAPLTDEARAAYGLPGSIRRGALITGVRPGSPADTAGLPLGGIIVTIDGRPIDTADDLVAFIRSARPGQEVELGYRQGERVSRKTVRLGPTANAIAPATPPFGGNTGPGSMSPGLGGGQRPLLNRLDRIVDNLGGGLGASTVYDPSELAALKKSVEELTEQVKALEERLSRLEGPGAAPPAAPAPAAGGFTP